MQLASELDCAQAQATEARDEVERISGDHLQAALRLPRVERAKRVDDPELTPVDRQSLIASLAGDEVEAGGWRPTLNDSRKNALLRAWGQNRHHASVVIRAFVLLGPICIFSLMTFRNTGEQIVGVAGSELLFTNPDGSHRSTIIGRDETFVIVRRFGEVYARAWKIRQGYALAPVTVN